jgi:hypothetical protein
MSTSMASTGRTPVVVTGTADYRAGVLAGLVSGVVMAMIMMAMTTFMMHMGPWAGAKMPWSLVAGKEAIRPGFELVPVMGGMMVHFALSAIYGLVFAWLAARTGMGLGLLGALFGFALYVLNIVVIPSLAAGWAGHMAPPNAMMHAVSAVEHVIFGVVLAAAYGSWRRG